MAGVRTCTAGTASRTPASFTDVWYLLEGSGTLVTGGALVGGVETGPGETRGRSIEGGDTKAVHAGDFALVPAGTPHWISRLETAELLYLVVKVPVRR
jgi:mannose-6-phosphate isomerase-like protein (cupin superfamily)